MQLTGIHHLTAVTAAASANHAFYTGTLGMRLVKRTVNQDDVSAYHLFYADGRGNPGTDLTFFDWPAKRERRGSGSIARTGLRVESVASLEYWRSRLGELGVRHSGIAEIDNRAILDFEDPEGQRLRLNVGGGREFQAWHESPVPEEHQVRGLGPITLSVAEISGTDAVLTEVMGMRPVREYEAASSDGSGGASSVRVYEMGAGGASAELHVAIEPRLPRVRSGAGGVHHVAFRVPSFGEYEAWNERLQSMRVPSSGPIDRYYFRSLYFREPGGILFELATDGPGFAADEPVEDLGKRLALPPFLEPRRAEIERGLKPL